MVDHVIYVLRHGVYVIYVWNFPDKTGLSSLGARANGNLGTSMKVLH